MTKKISILVFALAFLSCNQREDSRVNTQPLYFDLKGYFEKEVRRLNQSKPRIEKTVGINGNEEHKSILIKDWNKELAIFINADINKNSWKGDFKRSIKDGSATYRSDNKKIPVKKIAVTYQGLDVSKIEIIINKKNILYQSDDTLTYSPNAFYSIKKTQNIRLLSPKSYSVIAKFIP